MHTQPVSEDPSRDQLSRTPEPPRHPTSEDAANVAAAAARFRVLGAVTACLLPVLLTYLAVEAHNWPMVAVVLWVSLLGLTVLASDSASARHAVYVVQDSNAAQYDRLDYDRRNQFDMDCQAVQDKQDAAIEQMRAETEQIGVTVSATIRSTMMELAANGYITASKGTLDGLQQPTTGAKATLNGSGNGARFGSGAPTVPPQR